MQVELMQNIKIEILSIYLASCFLGVWGNWAVKDGLTYPSYSA